MSTQPQTNLDGPVDGCVTTNNVVRFCKVCGDDISHKRPQATHCSRSCQAHSARGMASELVKELKVVSRNIADRYLNRDRAFSFDGRYEGPVNRSVTCEVEIKKDRGYHAMPIDVHVPTAAPKFTQVTPEDVNWGKRQARPTQLMPRKHNSFCAVCVEMVIDKQQHSVRVTKGVYLPIEHQCNSVRVYDLRGTLLEVKPL